ncbi:2059_t:CDS:2 [Diversispora eburnea]|uniref:2059_t:CDS:1 n=1 Tax=Diversispora eburnea TaxID=1213867 RepID=A0A9N9GUU0_9GLOM|nr:2059_t:CDS:2 [Diversispora eburnea]
MSQTERKEICYLRCTINSGRLEFTWSIITPSIWDWIGLYEDHRKSNREWLNGHWFYISNHSNRTTLPDGRYVYSGSHRIGTVSGMNQIRLNNYEINGKYKTYSYANVYNPVFIYFDINRVNYTHRGLQHTFDNHKENWGFTKNDHWNNQNGKKLQRTLQEWKLSDAQYKYVTQPPFRLNAVVLTVYEDILNEIANSEVERDDLIKQFLKIYKNDKNIYSDEVYNEIADFFELAENYIPLSFEGRDEIEPDDNYELDYVKVKRKVETTLKTLEKLAI